MNYTISPSQHRRWVANYFKFKVGELHHHLELMISTCDDSLRLFLGNQQQPEILDRNLIYCFSSFSNAIQTLKDSGSAFLDPKITWGDIKSFRHVKFFCLGWNAATHDGNPVISVWADGRYFVLGDIKRFNQNGELISIRSPKTDARIFCLEFSLDLSQSFKSRLAGMQQNPEPWGASPDVAEMESFMQSDIVSEYVQNLFVQNIPHIRQSVAMSNHDPVTAAIARLESVTQIIKPNWLQHESLKRCSKDFCVVSRGHVLAWCRTLEEKMLGDVTIRRKLAVFAFLFEYLCGAIR